MKYYINANHKETRKIVITEAERANYPEVEFKPLGEFDNFWDAFERAQNED